MLSWVDISAVTKRVRRKDSPQTLGYDTQMSSMLESSLHPYDMLLVLQISVIESLQDANFFPSSDIPMESISDCSLRFVN